MKKYLLFATALAALASCADDNYVGGENTEVQNETAGISFGSSFKAITRADHVGADAADLLGGKFIVEGFKGNGSDMTEVFNNYYVTWTENTAGKTESNTSDWEYVGTAVAAPSTLPSGAVQSIKYWDYSVSQYDFAAYSTGKLAAEKIKTSGNPGAGELLISTITKATPYAGPTYTLKGDVDALKECYISDMVTAYYKDDYQKEVQLTFRNLASKVRVALYETVPGYSVKDVHFYIKDNSNNADIKSTGTGSDELNNETVTLFTSGTGDANKFYTSGTYTVTFPTIGSSKKNESDYNKAHVSFVADASGSGTTQTFGELDYNADPSDKETSGKYLGRTSNNPSFAGTATPWYINVLPNENGTVLELRINYTLLATDGSGEEIHIHGAKAFVPAIYATWKPNYAYTYLFKISDNTNGWTNTTSTDPAGLFPITFDAVVIDSQDNEQTTITTVSTPSITTYQKGHVYGDGTTEGVSYDSSKGDIYIQVMRNDALVQHLATTGDNPIQVWAVTGNENNIVVSEAVVMDALNIRASYSSSSTKGRNGITLTRVETNTDFNVIPGVDGNNINITAGDAAKFTPTAGLYAVTYKGTDSANTFIYSAQELTSKPSDWDTSGVWFKDPNGQTSVDTYADGTYYKKYTNRNIDWAVKVINVK